MTSAHTESREEQTMVHVKNCPIGKRGYPSTEDIIDGKEYIYCQGWAYSENDELLKECQTCADHVDKAQSDLDQILKGTDDED